jgi:hypothetical protein
MARLVTLSAMIATGIALASTVAWGQACPIGSTGQPWCFPDETVCPVGCVGGRGLCETQTCSATSTTCGPAMGTITGCAPGTLKTCGQISLCEPPMLCKCTTAVQEAIEFARRNPSGSSDFVAERSEILADGTVVLRRYHVYADGSYMVTLRDAKEQNPYSVILINTREGKHHLLDVETKSIISYPIWPIDTITWAVLQADRALPVERRLDPTVKYLPAQQSEDQALSIPSTYVERMPSEMYALQAQQEDVPLVRELEQDTIKKMDASYKAQGGISASAKKLFQQVFGLGPIY